MCTDRLRKRTRQTPSAEKALQVPHLHACYKKAHKSWAVAAIAAAVWSRFSVGAAQRLDAASVFSCFHVSLCACNSSPPNSHIPPASPRHAKNISLPFSVSLSLHNSHTYTVNQQSKDFDQEGVESLNCEETFWSIYSKLEHRLPLWRKVSCVLTALFCVISTECIMTARV